MYSGQQQQGGWGGGQQGSWQQSAQNYNQRGGQQYGGQWGQGQGGGQGQGHGGGQSQGHGGGQGRGGQYQGQGRGGLNQGPGRGGQNQGQGRGGQNQSQGRGGQNQGQGPGGQNQSQGRGGYNQGPSRGGQNQGPGRGGQNLGQGRGGQNQGQGRGGQNQGQGRGGQNQGQGRGGQNQVQGRGGQNQGQGGGQNQDRGRGGQNQGQGRGGQNQGQGGKWGGQDQGYWGGQNQSGRGGSNQGQGYNQGHGSQEQGYGGESQSSGYGEKSWGGQQGGNQQGSQQGGYGRGRGGGGGGRGGAQRGGGRGAGGRGGGGANQGRGGGYGGSESYGAGDSYELEYDEVPPKTYGEGEDYSSEGYGQYWSESAPRLGDGSIARSFREKLDSFFDGPGGQRGGSGGGGGGGQGGYNNQGRYGGRGGYNQAYGEQQETEEIYDAYSETTVEKTWGGYSEKPPAEKEEEKPAEEEEKGEKRQGGPYAAHYTKGPSINTAALKASQESTQPDRPDSRSRDGYGQGSNHGDRSTSQDRMSISSHDRSASQDRGYGQQGRGPQDKDRGQAHRGSQDRGGPHDQGSHERGGPQDRGPQSQASMRGGPQDRPGPGNQNRPPSLLGDRGMDRGGSDHGDGGYPGRGGPGPQDRDRGRGGPGGPTPLMNLDTRPSMDITPERRWLDQQRRDELRILEEKRLRDLDPRGRDFDRFDRDPLGPGGFRDTRDLDRFNLRGSRDLPLRDLPPRDLPPRDLAPSIQLDDVMRQLQQQNATPDRQHEIQRQLAQLQERQLPAGNQNAFLREQQIRLQEQQLRQQLLLEQQRQAQILELQRQQQILEQQKQEAILQAKQQQLIELQRQQEMLQTQQLLRAQHLKQQQEKLAAEKKRAEDEKSAKEAEKPSDPNDEYECKVCKIKIRGLMAYLVHVQCKEHQANQAKQREMDKLPPSLRPKDYRAISPPNKSILKKRAAAANLAEPTPKQARAEPGYSQDTSRGSMTGQPIPTTPTSQANIAALGGIQMGAGLENILKQALSTVKNAVASQHPTYVPPTVAAAVAASKVGASTPLGQTTPMGAMSSSANTPLFPSVHTKHFEPHSAVFDSADARASARPKSRSPSPPRRRSGSRRIRSPRYDTRGRSPMRRSPYRGRSPLRNLSPPRNRSPPRNVDRYSPPRPTRGFSPSGRGFSPPRRRASPSGGRLPSPPRRRISPSGGRLPSPPRRRISPSGGRLPSPPRRRMSPSGGRLPSPPRGRLPSPPRRRSPMRERSPGRFSPPRRNYSPTRGRLPSPPRGRLPSPPRGRLPSPPRRGSPPSRGSSQRNRSPPRTRSPPRDSRNRSPPRRSPPRRSPPRNRSPPRTRSPPRRRSRSPRNRSPPRRRSPHRGRSPPRNRSPPRGGRSRSPARLKSPGRRSTPRVPAGPKSGQPNGQSIDAKISTAIGSELAKLPVKDAGSVESIVANVVKSFSGKTDDSSKKEGAKPSPSITVTLRGGPPPSRSGSRSQSARRGSAKRDLLDKDLEAVSDDEWDAWSGSVASLPDYENISSDEDESKKKSVKERLGPKEDERKTTVSETGDIIVQKEVVEGNRRRSRSLSTPDSLDGSPTRDGKRKQRGRKKKRVMKPGEPGKPPRRRRSSSLSSVSLDENEEKLRLERTKSETKTVIETKPKVEITISNPSAINLEPPGTETVRLPSSEERSIETSKQSNIVVQIKNTDAVKKDAGKEEPEEKILMPRPTAASTAGGAKLLQVPPEQISTAYGCVMNAFAPNAVQNQTDVGIATEMLAELTQALVMVVNNEMSAPMRQKFTQTAMRFAQQYPGHRLVQAFNLASSVTPEVMDYLTKQNAETLQRITKVLQMRQDIVRTVLYSHVELQKLMMSLHTYPI